MLATASKASLRTDILARRDTVPAPAAAAFAQTIATAGAELVRKISAQIIAAYWPIKSEVSPLPLLESLAASACVTALPVMCEPEKTLVFRRWKPGDELIAAPFGVKQPAPDAPLVQPDVIITPLVGFDRRGYRLGYGAGFYDRTFAALPENRRPITIGVAYALQEVTEIPIEAHDQKLDYILTDREWIACRA